MSENKVEWLRLDNAAKIYPSTTTFRWNCVFRVSAVLKQKVDSELLQEALECAIKRYPSLQVTIKKGFFWYYVQNIDEIPQVAQENYYPCEKFNLKSRGLLFRMLYNKHRISLEFFHSIGDGAAAISLLNTTLLKYFHLQGKKVSSDNIIHYESTAIEEEYEDSYLKYYDESYGRQTRKEKSAYHLLAAKEVGGVVNVYQGEIDTTQLKQVSRELGVTINELLVATAAYVAYETKLNDARPKNKKNPVKIQFAINLRSMLPSMTLRNFSAIAVPTLEESADGKMTYMEVIQKMSKKCKEEASVDKMREFINANCSVEKNVVVKFVPLFIKSIALKVAFYKVGEDLATLQISNLGIVKTPKEFEEYVERYECMMGPQRYNNYSITMVTYATKSVITVTNTVKTRAFERNFFRLLSSIGIDVTVNYNRDVKSF